MHVNSRSGYLLGNTVRHTPCPVCMPPRPTPPPVIATRQQPGRTSVLVNAKRGNKRSKGQDKSRGDTGDQVSGWDAALTNIPANDEPASTSEPRQPQQGASEYVNVDEDMTAAAAAERTASQGPDPSDSEPSTSYAAGSSSSPPAKKPINTVISLAEYNLLLQAHETRERDIAAQKEREAREAAGGSSLAVPAPAPLELSRQGFQAFPMHGGEFELLVSETPAGQLVLSDCYLADKGPEEGSPAKYSRPQLVGGIPSEPTLYQIIPWVERGDGEIFKFKKPVAKNRKLYFIGIEPSPTGGLGNPVFDLDNVFEFDGGSRVLGRSEVRLVGTLPLVEPILRIRPNGLTLEESFLAPDPIEVSVDSGEQLADMTPEELEERLAELEQEAESLDEFDEMPDVPSVDMM